MAEIRVIAVINTAALLAILAWINSGHGEPPADQITTLAITAELQDRGLIDAHGDVTPAGREFLREHKK